MNPAAAPVRSRTAAVVAGIVAVAVAAFVVVLATRSGSDERAGASRVVGRLAPPVQGQTMADESFDLDAWRGRWVVVNFFATWCTPCVVEHPELIEFHERHQRTGDAELVSVLFDQLDLQEARDFFAERGGDWPVVIDGEGSAAVGYGVARVPESYVVAPDGTVVARLTGGVTAARLDQVLAQAARAAR